MSYECTEERFLRDVANHKLEIIKNDGVYRHIRLSDGSFNMRFDIITWPGHLCYTGDMGSYLFSRVEDMFLFFRGEGLRINTGYWAEKCLAAGVNDGISRYSSEDAEETITDILKEYDAPPSTAKEVEDILATCDIEDESALRTAIRDLEHDQDGIFSDFWEVSLNVRPFRYVWCCYALVWAISIYDAETAK